MDCYVDGYECGIRVRRSCLDYNNVARYDVPTRVKSTPVEYITRFMQYVDLVAIKFAIDITNESDVHSRLTKKSICPYRLLLYRRTPYNAEAFDENVSRFVGSDVASPIISIMRCRNVIILVHRKYSDCVTSYLIDLMQVLEQNESDISSDIVVFAGVENDLALKKRRCEG